MWSRLITWPLATFRRSGKLAQWQDFHAEFDYVMEYKSGKANMVADALSRKGELADISQPISDL